MARTAPVPNIPAIPGMCPGIAVLSGGAGMGGGSGKSAGAGGGTVGASGQGGAASTASDARGAPDGNTFPGCGTASHPVDVVTGRAFTHPIRDLYLPGLIPLDFERVYSSKMAGRDTGLGHGWGHSLGWEVVVERRQVTVWTPQGVAADFPTLDEGEQAIGPWGWVLRRESWGYGLDTDEGVWYLLGQNDGGGRHRLSALQDRNENRVELSYDRAGHLEEIVDSAGRKIIVSTTSAGRIASLKVEDPSAAGRTIVFARYTYDDRGNLVEAVDADGHVSRYEYDDDHRLTRDRDRAGLVFHFRYDELGRCLESWGDYGDRPDPSLSSEISDTLADGETPARGIHHCRFFYDEDGFSEVTDATEVRRFYGNDHGLLDKRVDGGGVTTYAYDDHGRMIGKTDPLGYTTRFERDRRGRITKRVDASERVHRVEYHASGLPERLVDPLGHQTLFERDHRGNLVRIVNAAGEVTTQQRDGRGLPMEVVDAGGQAQRMEFDEHANCTAITLPNGARWEYSYDYFGRRTTRKSPDGQVTRYHHSDRGDLLSVTEEATGGTERFEYDGEGHLVRASLPSGATVRYVWGGFHKLCDVVDPAGGDVALRYGREGQLLTVTNPAGLTHRRHYDVNLRLVGEDTIDGRKLRYENDLLGRLARFESDAGDVVDYAYAPTGELLSRTYADGSQDRLSYDAAGRVVSCDSGEAAFHLELDPVGRVLRETQIVDGEALWVRSRYDGRGARIECTTSDGHRERVARDAMGFRSRTDLGDDLVIEHDHDRMGREVSRRLPSGARIDSRYGPEGRLVERSAHEPTVAEPTGAPEWLGGEDPSIRALQRYGYDADGELVEQLDAERGTTRFAYDPLGRLEAMVPEAAKPLVFRYDAAGNRYEREGDEERPRRYDGLRLVEKGSTRYAYDEAGRLVEKWDGEDEPWRYHWSARGLLQRVERPDGTVVTFAYDAYARRLAKRVLKPTAEGLPPAPSHWTRFLWDDDRLVQEIRRKGESGADPVIETRTYAFEDGSLEPMAQRTDRASEDDHADWTLYLNGPEGAPRRLVDRRGRVVGELRHTGFGQLLVVDGDADCTFLRLQGQYEDEETGLAYNRHRYFDPDAGQWTGPDPMGLKSGIHPYRYAPNPFGWIDLDGLMPSYHANGKPTLLGRHMASRVNPVAEDPQYVGDPGPEGFHTYEVRSRFGPGDPGARQAWEKNQRRWIRDQIDSGRDIYTIGTPPDSEPSDFCAIEREELRSAGFTKRCSGKKVRALNPNTGEEEVVDLVQWAPPPGFEPGDYRRQRDAATNGRSP